MRETIEAIRVMGFWRWLWARTFYRKFQRLAHRYNWHHTTKLGPFEDGSQQQWCQWCGLRHVTYDSRHIVAQLARGRDGK